MVGLVARPRDAPLMDGEVGATTTQGVARRGVGAMLVLTDCDGAEIVELLDFGGEEGTIADRY